MKRPAKKYYGSTYFLCAYNTVTNFKILGHREITHYFYNPYPVERSGAALVMGKEMQRRLLVTVDIFLRLDYLLRE